MSASVQVLLKDVGPSCHPHPRGVQKHIHKQPTGSAVPPQTLDLLEG